MRILICSEFYAPSVGGTQKVLQEISENLARLGHEVTVATSFMAERPYTELNGVKICQFKIAGNLVYGMQGEIEAYRHFVVAGDFDALLVKAAQQWVFDALLPVLHEIKYRKVHIPCGYSGLYQSEYKDYFQQMPSVLRQLDHLIFYATSYRDLPFAREHGIQHYSVIPNGASEFEFSMPPDVDIRGKLLIPEKNFVFLTVGNPPLPKGHFEVVQAYEKLRLPFGSTLILNGCYTAQENPFQWSISLQVLSALKQIKRKIFPPPLPRPKSFADTICAIRLQPGKRVIIADLSRQDLLAAFFEANLFVFASRVEYSPLVLFEAAAAGLPFLSVPAGNAAEIAQWTGAGEICPADADDQGYLRANPSVLAGHMERLAMDQQRLKQLGTTGRQSWRERFTWEEIARQYERVLA